VYLTVTENFKREHGRDYLGSRDIDLGFHLEKNWNKADLENSDFALVIKTLGEMGFEPLGFRFVKHFRIDTYEELKSEDAKNIPLH